MDSVQLKNISGGPACFAIGIREMSEFIAIVRFGNQQTQAPAVVAGHPRLPHTVTQLTTGPDDSSKPYYNEPSS
jgi:hypothetical protein